MYLGFFVLAHIRMNESNLFRLNWFLKSTKPIVFTYCIKFPAVPQLKHSLVNKMLLHPGATAVLCTLFLLCPAQPPCCAPQVSPKSGATSFGHRRNADVPETSCADPIIAHKNKVTCAKVSVVPRRNWSDVHLLSVVSQTRIWLEPLIGLHGNMII